MDNFEKNFLSIKQYLEGSNATVTRFLYSKECGQISSLTIPTSKIISSSVNELMPLLTIEDEILYPDTTTGFSDPSSVQENYCLIGNFLGDARDTIKNSKSHITSTITFPIRSDSDLDIFHDLRNEIMIEAIKAGIDINFHYTSDNIVQSFSFNAYSFLNLADSIQKIKFLINNIVGSYGQSVNIDETTVVLEKKDDKVINKQIKDNPYIFLRNLQC
jgi:hypothetical protein